MNMKHVQYEQNPLLSTAIRPLAALPVTELGQNFASLI